jgi:hypothetical protein
MFEGLLNTVSTDEIEAEEAQEQALPAEEILARRQAIKNKIRSVGRMSRVMALLREEAERSSELRRIEEAEADEALDNHLTTGDQVARLHLHGFEDTYVFIPKYGICAHKCIAFTVEGQTGIMSVFLLHIIIMTRTKSIMTIKMASYLIVHLCQRTMLLPVLVATVLQSSKDASNKHYTTASGLFRIIYRHFKAQDHQMRLQLYFSRLLPKNCINLDYDQPASAPWAGGWLIDSNLELKGTVLYLSTPNL